MDLMTTCPNTSAEVKIAEVESQEAYDTMTIQSSAYECSVCGGATHPVVKTASENNTYLR